jgi:hypothetical protein
MQLENVIREREKQHLVVIVIMYTLLPFRPSDHLHGKPHKHYFSIKSIRGAFDNRPITKHSLCLFAALEAVQK